MRASRGGDRVLAISQLSGGIAGGGLTGLRGNVLRSTDGGQNWTALTTGLHVSITAGLIDDRGNYRLFTQGGQMLVSQGTGAQLHLVQKPARTPVAGATQSADGALVVAGSRGAQTLAADSALEF